MAEKVKQNVTRQIVENVDLPNDHGHMVRVSGEVVAEDMHFNDATGMLTVEKIYDAGNGRTAYAAISAVDNKRDRRAYVIEKRDNQCIVSNGSITLDLVAEDLIHLLSLALAENQQETQNRISLEHIRTKIAVNE